MKNQVRLSGGNTNGPKLVCINIQPCGSTQAPERSDILNIGGFSDAVFNIVASYLGDDANRFVAEVATLTFQNMLHLRQVLIDESTTPPPQRTSFEGGIDSAAKFGE